VVADLNLPVVVANLNLPVNVADLNLPVKVADLNLPVKVAVFNLPVVVADLNLPVNVAVLNLPTKVADLSPLVKVEGLILPVKQSWKVSTPPSRWKKINFFTKIIFCPFAVGYTINIYSNKARFQLDWPFILESNQICSCQGKIMQILPQALS